MTAIVSITEVQRPGRQFDSGLSRRESGRGAAAVGLSGDVSAAQMEALFGHRIDPRDDRFDQPSEWGEAAQIGGPRRRYASAQELYERALNTEPDASGERREELRLNAERTARRNVQYLDITFSVQLCRGTAVGTKWRRPPPPRLTGLRLGEAPVVGTTQGTSGSDQKIRLSRIVSTTEAMTDTSSIVRQPTPPPTGRISVLPNLILPPGSLVDVVRTRRTASDPVGVERAARSRGPDPMPDPALSAVARRGMAEWRPCQAAWPRP
jgi:hypothetical protein